MRKKQILIFDSGVGGLSIFDEVVQKTASIDCFYLFDDAYFPYGELADDFLITRLTTLLLSFVKKQHVDLIIIACNTASTIALSTLRSHFSIPVVGVVPAIKPAAQLTNNGIIGLLATPGTIKRSYTSLLINKFASDKKVLKIGSTELVKLAEEKLQGCKLDSERLQKVLAPWLGLQNKPDTLVLGCTHFPLLKTEIAACFKNNIQLVDSGKAIANRVKQLLGGGLNCQVAGEYRVYHTKAYGDSEDETLAALQARFSAYGFKSLAYFP